MKIKPTKLVKGQCVAKWLTEGNEKALNMGNESDTDMALAVIDDLQHRDWYKDIVFYLKNLSCPNHLIDHKKRALRLKAAKYSLIQEGLG